MTTYEIEIIKDILNNYRFKMNKYDNCYYIYKKTKAGREVEVELKANSFQEFVINFNNF